ncbi:MAG: hypothetical protein K6G12_08280 [Lachnospiraceae bacterium]|nr:hypothetical protein [Lachnospiraceae bacterium]
MNFDIPAPKQTGENIKTSDTKEKKATISPITTDTRMAVSGILHRGESRSVCVMLEDNERSIEIRLPEGEILSRKGYTEEEAEEILAYLNENMDDIMNTAREVNPMKAFMK